MGSNYIPREKCYLEIPLQWQPEQAYPADGGDSTLKALQAVKDNVRERKSDPFDGVEVDDLPDGIFPVSEGWYMDSKDSSADPHKQLDYVTMCIKLRALELLREENEFGRPMRAWFQGEVHSVLNLNKEWAPADSANSGLFKLDEAGVGHAHYLHTHLEKKRTAFWRKTIAATAAAPGAATAYELIPMTALADAQLSDEATKLTLRLPEPYVWGDTLRSDLYVRSSYLSIAGNLLQALCVQSDAARSRLYPGVRNLGDRYHALSGVVRVRFRHWLLLGCPGIGKSCFGLFFSWVLTRLQIPFAYVLAGTNERLGYPSISTATIQDLAHDASRVLIWDAGDKSSQEQMPVCFGPFALCISSMQPLFRYTRFRDGATIFQPPLWQREELEAVFDQHLVDRLFGIAGGVPRTYFNELHPDIESISAELATLSNALLDKLMHAVVPNQASCSDVGRRLLAFVSDEECAASCGMRFPFNRKWQRTEFISEFVPQTMLGTLLTRRFEHFRQLIDVPDERSVYCVLTRHLWEMYCHRVLQCGVVLSGYKLGIASPIATGDTPVSAVTFTIPAMQPDRYVNTDHLPSPVVSDINTYHFPSAKNGRTIDSFMHCVIDVGLFRRRPVGCFHLIHCTVGSGHSIELGPLNSLCQKLDLSAGIMDSEHVLVNMVFLVPDIPRLRKIWKRPQTFTVGREPWRENSLQIHAPHAGDRLINVQQYVLFVPVDRQMQKRLVHLTAVNGMCATCKGRQSRSGAERMRHAHGKPAAPVPVDLMPGLQGGDAGLPHSPRARPPSLISPSAGAKRVGDHVAGEEEDMKRNASSGSGSTDSMPSAAQQKGPLAQSEKLQEAEQRMATFPECIEHVPATCRCVLPLHENRRGYPERCRQWFLGVLRLNPTPRGGASGGASAGAAGHAVVDDRKPINE